MISTRFRRSVLVAIIVLTSQYGGAKQSQGSALAPEYHKWLDEDVRWLISVQEEKEFMKLTTDEQRDHFVVKFWEQRNPNPGSKENAFKEEHYRRLAFSNQHFAESGKTQLFRIIAGLNKPTSGRVSINGTDRPVQAGEVGVVAQDYPLFEHRTVMSNLLLAAKQKENEDKVAHDKVVHYLTEFELIDKARLYPVQLSGGQRQRCAIIQQILCSDHFLLMDEPFSGLDLLVLERTSELIQKVANIDELNTIIVVTHDITAAAAVADHLWLMGRDHDSSGRPLPGSHIVETYHLIERDLCWHPQIITQPRFVDFVREIKERFRTL